MRELPDSPLSPWLAELLLRDRDEFVKECPFVNRRTIPWPGEPLASVAKHALRNYLRVEDAVHERILARVGRGGPVGDEG